MTGIFTPAGDAEEFIAYRSNAIYGEDTGVNQTSTTALAANTIYAMPVFVRAPATIFSFAFCIGTPVAGVNARVAIYASRNDAPAPGALLFGSNTVLDCGLPAGTALGDGTPGNNLRVPRGVIWLACKFSGAAQPRCFNAAGSPGSPDSLPGRLLGVASFAAACGLDAGGASSPMCVSAADTFANPWPASFPTPIFGPHLAPIMAWRHA